MLVAAKVKALAKSFARKAANWDSNDGGDVLFHNVPAQFHFRIGPARLITEYGG